MHGKPTSLALDHSAAILDLERRVALLEQGLYGHAAPSCATPLLIRCYVQAHHLMRRIDPDSSAAWVANAYLWDVRALVALGRAVNDPFPYRPLLAVVDLCVLKGVQGAAEARGHLESVAQDLLRAQGLELVTPRDTMGRLRLQEALSNLPIR